MGPLGRRTAALPPPPPRRIGWHAAGGRATGVGRSPWRGGARATSAATVLAHVVRHVISLSQGAVDMKAHHSLVSGTMFHDHGDVRCRFCSIDVPGRCSTTAPSPASCPIQTLLRRAGKPPVSFGCMVHVSMNGVDYTQRCRSVLYYNLSHIAIAALRPSGGRRSVASSTTGTGRGPWWRKPHVGLETPWCQRR